MTSNSLQINILCDFISGLVENSHLATCLVLDHSDFRLFPSLPASLKIDRHEAPQFPKSGHWDLVIGSFPIGLKEANPRMGPDSFMRSMAAGAALNCLKFIKRGGYGIFFIEPYLVINQPQRGQRGFRDLVNEAGLLVSAIINSPNGILLPASQYRPIIVVIENAAFSEEFIGELESQNQAKEIGRNLRKRTFGSSLADGISLHPYNFKGFEKWRISKKIDALETEYKTFRTLKIEEFSRIFETKPFSSHVHSKNSIYIPRIGTASVTSDLSEISLWKPHKYFQVQCDPSIVNAEYLAAFFDSGIGKLIFSSMFSESQVKTISARSICETIVCVPELDVQIEIVESLEKIKTIKRNISEYEKNIALNPMTSHALSKIESVLGAVGELTDGDRIKNLIRDGESKHTEFKETFSYCVREKQSKDYVEDSAIKTIAAFLNSDGGNLLIGIRDDGAVTGLNVEIDKLHKSSSDKFLLRFKDKLKNRIGEQHYPYINQRIVDINGLFIFLVECAPSPTAAFVDDKEFYVRTNPATDQLTGQKLATYLMSRFHN